ncbi:MAG: methionyl-tRNA formyltransferase [Candidatus Omnitrophica bacterium]|jgi:methionyl-tRNA formyltransferase|nr:methionyl-tRNA formyltransferase [Candidatus Omnitrophota bacterium]
MRIIFLGSAGFAVPSLEMLIDSKHEISCVVTQPDRKKGRGQKISPVAVKQAAIERAIEVFSPEDINAAESVSLLKSKKADLFIVIAYGQILSQEILDIPKVMPINLHASLLPAYRGAAPINWAIINQERTTGVTVMKITLKMDSGPVILKQEIKILDSDNAMSLSEKLSLEGSRLLSRALDLISSGKYDLLPQDDKKASYAPKLKKSHGQINWEKSAEEISHLIRGCLPWPTAFTYLKGHLLKIEQAQAVHCVSKRADLAFGAVEAITKDGILVKCGMGCLLIKKLKPEGKRLMSSAEFTAGHKLIVGDIFSVT